MTADLGAITLEQLNALAIAGKLSGLVSVPIDLYHAGPGVSSTGLKDILKSPAHYKASKERREDSDAFRFGRLAHTRILEPELYAETVAIEPAANGRTTVGKQIKAAFAATTVGKTVVSNTESVEIERLASAIQANRLAAKILAPGGLAELSVYWTDAATGVLCKARADLIRGDAIFDLKTCWSASPKDFPRDILKYQYHVSAAFYLDGFRTVMPARSFAWIAAEKAAPFSIGFYAATEEVLSAGRGEYERALATYAECSKSNQWPGYPQEFVNVSL